MRAGRAIRAETRDRNLPPCHCGHSQLQHREYAPTWSIVEGELVETPHPNYRPGLFKCDHCSCEIDKS